jgi:hypothetical protein
MKTYQNATMETPLSQSFKEEDFMRLLENTLFCVVAALMADCQTLNCFHLYFLKLDSLFGS